MLRRCEFEKSDATGNDQLACQMKAHGHDHGLLKLCRHISGHENKIEPAMYDLWRQLHVHGAILARLLYCTSIAGS